MAKRAKKATDRRDALIHRQVFQNQLLPARRSQVPEELNVQAIKLVQDLKDILDDAFELNSEGWAKRRRG